MYEHTYIHMYAYIDEIMTHLHLRAFAASWGEGLDGLVRVNASYEIWKPKLCV